LAGQLNLDKLEPLKVADDTDSTVCNAYPERGVLFMLEQTSDVTPVNSESKAVDARRVSQVVLQPIDAKAFAYRAESHLFGPYVQNIGDLKTAIALDPECARAYWLLARIYLATGQADLADTAAAEACDIEADNASYQLCHAQTRALLGEYDDAVIAVRAVLDRKDVSAIDGAQALHQMGQLGSLGDREIASKAISFENQAIEAADKLATSSDARERRAAKQLLVEGHLAVAEEIARQPFNQKVESLSEWFGRASGFAEEYIEKDGGSIELRLLIAQHALNALASFKPTLDPAPWIAEAEEAAQELLAQSNDELWQQQVKWELGLAYLHALRIEHARRETDAALKYGQHAIDNLSVGASSRQAVHSSELLVGQLYFQMGAVHAVHKLDHAKAVQWYDKAAPLLASKWPASELFAPRREGEMLVSMGVSYWQTGDKARALELTKSGVGLVETAVEGGVLEKSTLAVPYGNLANMYDQMGEATNAAKYNDLAKSVSAEAKVDTKANPQQPRVGRRQMSQTRRVRAR
jgi:tetratricopeptide (TPR) repeat protein